MRGNAPKAKIVKLIRLLVLIIKQGTEIAIASNSLDHLIVCTFYLIFFVVCHTKTHTLTLAASHYGSELREMNIDFISRCSLSKFSPQCKRSL